METTIIARYSGLQRYLLIVTLGVLSAFGPMSTDLYLPSMTAMTDYFQTSLVLMQLTLSTFLVGFSVGTLVYGPLSDHFGRKVTLLSGAMIYTSASLICAFSPNMDILLAARFVQALGACSGPIIARAVVRDLFKGSEATQILSITTAIMSLAPFLAPMMGGFLQTRFNWHMDFIFLAAFGAVALGLIYYCVPNYPPTKAMDPPLHQVSDYKNSVLFHVLHNYLVILKNRQALLYILAMSFVYAGMFSFISGASLVVMGIFHVGAQNFSYAFACVVVGYLLGNVTVALFGKRFSREQLVLWGTYCAMIAGLILVLFSFRGQVSLAGFLAPMSLFFFSAAFILPVSILGAISVFPQLAGTTSSLGGFIQMLGGGLIAWLIGLTFDGTPRVLSLLVFSMGIASFLCIKFKPVLPVED